MEEKSKRYKKALSYAYRLLSYRPRSKKELIFRLIRKKYKKKVVKEVIQFLEKIEYVDDKKFAKYWIRNRLTAKPCGVSLLYYELKEKGVSKNIIHTTIEELCKDYDEEEVAVELAKKRKEKIRDKDEIKCKRKVLNFLRRRGFSYSNIYDAIEKVFNKK